MAPRALRWLVALPGVAEAITSAFFCPPKGEQDHAYSVPLSGDHYLPVFASHPPGVEKDGIEQAIIVMHGAPRSGMQYFRDTLDVVEKQKKGDVTVVIAPVIPDKPCMAKDWSNRRRQQVPEDFRAPVWDTQREWMFGAGSDRRRRRQGISSFDAMDALVDWTQESYPEIDRLVVTGFSAGGQMVLRWAVLSPEGTNGKTRYGGLDMRIIIGSPSTVLYLTEDRPKKVCRPDEDKGQYHKCKAFFKPKGNCGGDWDKYGFGLDGLQKGASHPGTIRGAAAEYAHWYLDAKNDAATGKELRERFASKDIRFVFGAKDTRHCSISVCSDDCGAMLQGANRLQRGLNYMGHLKDVLPHYKPKYSIFYGGHDNYAAFISHDWIIWALPYNDRDFKVLDRVVKQEGHKEKGFKSRYFAAFECMSRCDKDNQCHSFTYNPWSGHCDLFDQCVTSKTKMVGTASKEAGDQTYFKKCKKGSRLYTDESIDDEGEDAGQPAWRRPGSAVFLAAGGIVAAVVSSFVALAAWRKLGPFSSLGTAARELGACIQVERDDQAVELVQDILQVE